MYPLIVDGGNKLVFMHSTALYPFLPYIASADGKGARPLAPQALPSDFPAGNLVEPEQVLFKAADGLEIHGQLFKPAGNSARAPAVVFSHGGPMRQMLLGWHYLEYYYNAYAFNQYLASRGYVVLSDNYRCGIGYGRAFREAKHRDPGSLNIRTRRRGCIWGPLRRGLETHRLVGRVLWRLSDSNGPGARFRDVRGGSRPPWSS